jgi:hypothetical protein
MPFLELLSALFCVALQAGALAVPAISMDIIVVIDAMLSAFSLLKTNRRSALAI